MTAERFIGASALALVLLAGCGVDGPPQPPEPREERPAAITIGGTARAGVIGGS